MNQWIFIECYSQHAQLFAASEAKQWFLKEHEHSVAMFNSFFDAD